MITSSTHGPVYSVLCMLYGMVIIINNNVSIYMAHISGLGLLMAPYIILSLVIESARSCTISTPRKH